MQTQALNTKTSSETIFVKKQLHHSVIIQLEFILLQDGISGFGRL